MSVLANHGITLRGIAFDTMLESYVLNAVVDATIWTAWRSVTLGTRRSTSEDIAGKGAKQLT